MLVNANNLKILRSVENNNRGIFSIEPLPQTYGSTIGNALRRVLLTSIKGSAGTQLKITGANHQFTTIEGVKEDIVQITLNLKQVRFKVHTANPVILSLEKKGRGVVTASDFKPNSDVDILTPQFKIATLADDNSTLKLELMVEQGVGYSPSEQREKQNNKLGVITLDALFSPIKNVMFNVESARFGERVDFDKLNIEIETDGSISPEEALKEASEILKSYYNVIGLIDSHSSDNAAKENTQMPVLKKIKSNIENISIDELPLQTRTINALRKSGILTLKQLASKSNEELADVKNLGEKSLTEIKELLSKESI